MKKVQNNRHSMHLSTQAELNKNAVLLMTIPGYAELKANIDTGIAKEHALAAQQLTYKNYRALPKNLARNAASNYTLDLASKIKAYALIARNYNLLEKVKLTATDISRSGDSSLVSTIGNLLSCAYENLEVLAGYGVTAELLSNGKVLLDTYKNEIFLFRKNKAELYGITKQLEGQLRATLSVIHIVDAIIESVRVSDPLLYNSYSTARAKINSACTKVSVKGRVFEADTDEPLTGAILTVERVTADNTQTTVEEPVRKICVRSSNGCFRFKSISSGTYLFKVSYYGCNPKESTVYINEGVMARVELGLGRIG